MTHITTQPHKLITVILPKGKDKDLVCKLVNDLKINSMNVNFARGLGRITPHRHRGVEDATEKAIVSVLIEEARADEVFEFIFYEADINQPHGGLMFQQPILANTLYSLPDIESEE